MEGPVTNFKTVSSKSSENASLLSGVKNPLKVAGIIRCVFTFLPLRDLKNCRFVSKEWNYEAEPFLRKLSRITIGSQYGNGDFKNAFRFSQTKIPFNALRLLTFRGYLYPMMPWTESGLQEVFADWKTKLKELTILQITIMDDRFLPRHFNMSDVLNEVSITKLNAASYHDCQLTFSLKNLLRVKHLRLRECELIITEDRLAANHVEIKSCKLVFQNDNVERTLNSFINFETAKKVIYHGFGLEGLKLYTDGRFQLDLLELKYVSILDWETSNWEVDKLYLFGVNFSGITQMRVREMKVEMARVALRDIPESVEKLTCADVGCLPLPPVSLPDLKYLVVSGESCDVLKCIKNYPSLISLELDCNFNILSKLIPQNLKQIRMKYSALFSGKQIVNCETLIMDGFPANRSRYPTETLQAQKIIWRIMESPHTKLQFEKVLNFISKHDKKVVAVGKFKWKKVNFAKCPLSKIVDKESEYYVFENGKGIAISKDQFNKMKVLVI